MKAKGLTRETILDLATSERNFPEFEVGDAIAVSQWIKEGTKSRVQIFEGDVIAMHKNGISSTFTVRKIGSDSCPIERIYPFYSPIIDSIKLVHKGDVRRAKLYYMRDRIGKKARVKERILTKQEKELANIKAAAQKKAAEDSKASEQA